MLRRISFGFRPFFIGPKKYSTQSLDSAQKDIYYKNLAAEQENDSNPPGWDEALPFESMPGPKPFPLVGNLFRFLPGGELHSMKFEKIIKSFRKKYGEVVRLGGIPGRNDFVFLYDPADMENLLRNAGVFPNRKTMDCVTYYRYTLRKEWFQGYGGLTSEQGEGWYKTRTAVNPILMQPRTIQQYTTKMDDIAKDLIKYIKHHQQKTGKSEVADNFADVFYKWGIESVATVALNKRLGALDINMEENAEVHRYIEAIISWFQQLYYLEVLPPYWKYLPSKIFNEFVKTQDIIMSTTKKYVEEGLKKGEDSTLPEHEQSVLQRLSKHDKQIALVMTVEMLGGGIDTTGKTLGTALYFLAKSPEKQRKLREEVVKVMPNKNSKITNETLSKMQYLKAVIKETIRLVPIGVGNMRTTSKNMVIGGYRIPKDTNVVTAHLYTSTMTDEYFKEPEKFVPERWLKSTTDEYSFKNINRFVYMPFGFGPRSCIGKRLANLELEVAIANIIRNYDVSWNQPDLRFGAKLLYGFLDPLRLTLEEIN